MYAIIDWSIRKGDRKTEIHRMRGVLCLYKRIVYRQANITDSNVLRYNSGSSLPVLFLQVDEAPSVVTAPQAFEVLLSSSKVWGTRDRACRCVRQGEEGKFFQSLFHVAAFSGGVGATWMEWMQYILYASCFMGKLDMAYSKV